MLQERSLPRSYEGNPNLVRPTVARNSCPLQPSRVAINRKGPISSHFVEADDGSRTRDLRLGKPTLYQLSYVRVVGDFTSQPPTVEARPDSGPNTYPAAPTVAHAQNHRQMSECLPRGG